MLKLTHYLLPQLYRLNILKGTPKAPTVDLLRLNTLTGTKTAFLPLKGMMSTSVLFIWDSKPGFWDYGVKFLLQWITRVLYSKKRFHLFNVIFSEIGDCVTVLIYEYFENIYFSKMTIVEHAKMNLQQHVKHKLKSIMTCSKYYQ